GGERGEGEEQDEGGAGDQPSGAADAFHDAGGGGAGAVAFFADAGEDEHLVVHGQAVEEGEGDQGDPVGDGPGRGQAPDGVRAVAVLPDHHDHAVGGADRREVEGHGLDGEQQGAERLGEQDHGDRGQHRDQQREPPVEGVVLVQEQGARAAGQGCADRGYGVADRGQGGRAGGGGWLGGGLGAGQGGAGAGPGRAGGGGRRAGPPPPF